MSHFLEMKKTAHTFSGFNSRRVSCTVDKNGHDYVMQIENWRYKTRHLQSMKDTFLSVAKLDVIHPEMLQRLGFSHE